MERQIGIALSLYVQDYDETWPRNDDCLNNDSQPFPLVETAHGCSGPFGNRINHFKWYWWLYPYVKNVQIFRCPSRQIVERDDTGQQDWYHSAEIFNGYALNLSITGSLNTWGNPNRIGAFRNSFTGGTLAGLETPSETFLVMEHWFPGVWAYVTPRAVVQTAYPLATREVWERALKPNDKVDRRAVPHSEGFNFAFGDGHAKFLNVNTFLSKCPPSAEYPVSNVPNPYPGGMVWTITNPPTWSHPWPLWGLN